MNTVLIATKNSEINGILTMLIASNFECNILETTSHQEARDTVISDTDIGLVLSDQSPVDGEIFNQIKKTEKEIPYFLLSNMTNAECPKDFLSTNSPHRNIPIKFKKSVLTNELDGILPIWGSEDDDFSRVKISTFFDGYLKYADTHLQLSPSKFVKITDKNDTFASDIVSRLAKRNIQYLWIQKDDYEVFIDTIMIEIFNKIKDPEIQTSSRIKLQIESIEKLHECIQNLGITKQTISLTDTVIELALITTEQNDELRSCGNLIKKNVSYTFIHSRLSAYIASTIVEEMNWSTGLIVKNLAMAAIFQNITLPETDLASIQSLDGDDFNQLSQSKKRLVQAHMLEAIKLLEKLPKCSGEVQKLIQYHHELPESKGFPRGLSASVIPQLSCLFIIAVQFAHELIIRGIDNNTINGIVEEFESKFDYGNFKNSLNVFMAKFKNRL